MEEECAQRVLWKLTVSEDGFVDNKKTVWVVYDAVNLESVAKWFQESELDDNDSVIGGELVTLNAYIPGEDTTP